jgi:hypothetical protein
LQTLRQPCAAFFKEHAMTTGTLTPAEQAQLSSAQRTAATPPTAIDADTRRKTIPLGAPLATTIILTDKEAPYRPSPQVDERVIDHIEGAEDFAAYLMPAKSALGHATNSLKQIDEARTALLKDTSLTDELRCLRLEPGAIKKHDSILATFSKASSDLNVAAKMIEDQLNTSVVSASSTPAATELRAVLRAMPEKERMEAIGKAIRDGDDAIIHAVLGSHPITAGVGLHHHQMWTRQIRERRQPELVRRLTATQKAIEILERTAPIALAEVERAARFKFKDVAKLREKSNASAAALAKLG